MSKMEDLAKGLMMFPLLILLAGVGECTQNMVNAPEKTQAQIDAGFASQKAESIARLKARKGDDK